MITESGKQVVKRIVPPKWRRHIREFLVARGTRQLYGPKRLELRRDEAVVTCVVKNGEFYIESFIEHYTGMGFRHIFFLDNGSTDNTIAIARRYSNVSMCQSTLPIEAHQGLFKKYLAQTSAGGGWCLDVDIDEFFDYPLADQVTLNDFLRYLNRKDASAVVTQMLDMFSDRALADLVTETPHDLKSTYRYYDIADVRKCDYRQAELGALFGSDNLPCSARTQLYFGGIRKALYGHECLLTKHSLFVPARVPDLFRHVHFVNGAWLADLSCVLYHYKLTPNAADVARQNERHFPGNRQLYADSIVFLNNTLHRRITRDTAQFLGSVNDLVTNGFLFASEEYLQGHSRHTN